VIALTPAKDAPLGELRFTAKLISPLSAKIIAFKPEITCAGVSYSVSPDGKTANLSFSPMQGGDQLISIFVSSQSSVRIEGNRDLQPFTINIR
jgi:hypothetical protein